MKILVFSDSHSSRRFMRQCVDVLQPDGIIHLGDMVQDGEVLSEEYPSFPITRLQATVTGGGLCPAFRKYG